MMTNTQLTIYIILIAIIIVSIGTIMEIYKKIVRRNKAKRLELYIIGFLLTALSLLMLVSSHMYHPILTMIGGPIWIDYIAYMLVIFALQLQADMKILKKIVRALLKNILKKANFTDQQIADILTPSKK